MQSTLAGKLRNRIFTPDPREVTFERRGFYSPGSEQQANLEKVGLMFLAGFEYGISGRTLREIEAALDAVDRPFRGFAYEGCAMALAVRDALRPASRHWVRDFVAGDWGKTPDNRRARYYRLTAAGRKHLGIEVQEYVRVNRAIARIIQPAES